MTLTEFLIQSEYTFICAFLIFISMIVTPLLIMHWSPFTKVKKWVSLGLIIGGVLYFNYVLIPIKEYAYAHPTKTVKQEYFKGEYKNITCNDCTILVEITNVSYPMGFASKSSEDTLKIMIIK